MRSNRYIHPEFGFLAPTSRLRRELRVGLFSMLFGIGVGVAAVAALRVDSRDRHSGSVSPVETRRGLGALIPNRPRLPLNPVGVTQWHGKN